MKSIKKLAALLTAGAMVLSISACAEVDKIGKVKDEISKINDFNSTLKFDVTMKVGENDTNVVSETEISYLKDPLLLKMIRTTEQSENIASDSENKDESTSETETSTEEPAEEETVTDESESLTEDTTENEETVMYAETKDNTNTIYMGYAGKWMKQSLESEDMNYITNQYNIPEIVKLILANGKDFKETGTENINGAEAVKYDGTFDVTALQVFINETKVLDFIGMSGLPDTFYDGVGETTVSVWVDKKTNLPVKFSVDIAECVQKLTDNLIATSGQEVTEEQKLYLTKYLVESDIRDVNNVESFELPEETKTAEEYVAPEQTTDGATDGTTTDGTTESSSDEQSTEPESTENSNVLNNDEAGQANN